MTTKIYHVFIVKTGEEIASGTAKECAEQMNMTLKEFINFVDQIDKRKIRKYDIIRVDFEEDG